MIWEFPVNTDIMCDPSFTLVCYYIKQSGCLEEVHLLTQLYSKMQMSPSHSAPSESHNNLSLPGTCKYNRILTVLTGAVMKQFCWEELNLLLLNPDTWLSADQADHHTRLLRLRLVTTLPSLRVLESWETSCWMRIMCGWSGRLAPGSEGPNSFLLNRIT